MGDHAVPFTYEHGFIRRGLWGELLHRVFGTWAYHYFFLAAIGLALLALIIGVIFRASRRLDGAEQLRAAGDRRLARDLVRHASGRLSRSPGVSRRPRRLRPAPAADAPDSWPPRTVAVLTPLVHEAAIFWIGPLLGLALLRGPRDDRQPETRRGLVRVAAAILVIFAVSTSVVSVFGGASPALANRDSRRRHGSSRRPTSSGRLWCAVHRADPAADMRSRWASVDTLLDLLWSVMIFAPGSAFLAWLAVRRVRERSADALASARAAALIVAAIVSPLALHAVGWDLHRWNALSAFNAVLGALMVFGTSTAARDSMLLRPTLLAVTLSVAIWGVASDLILFDSYGANRPPFISQIMFLYESATTGGWSIWIPDQ